MEIKSVNNELVKNTVKLQQKKYRNSEKKFLLEKNFFYNPVESPRTESPYFRSCLL